MDLESKRPPPPLFRVGRDDDAWAIPDWAYAKEDGTFGNRFDDPMRVYRVLYASSQRLGCFIETLARFRVDVSFIADLALMENGEDDFTALGTVRRAWIKGRCIGTANVVSVTSTAGSRKTVGLDFAGQPAEFSVRPSNGRAASRLHCVLIP